MQNFGWPKWDGLNWELDCMQSPNPYAPATWAKVPILRGELPCAPVIVMQSPLHQSHKLLGVTASMIRRKAHYPSGVFLKVLRIDKSHKRVVFAAWCVVSNRLDEEKNRIASVPI